MATNSIVCRHIFGVNTQISKNITILDETNYAYISGSRIVVYNSLDKRQRYIHDLEIVNNINTFGCCSGKKLAVIAEKGNDGSSVSRLHVFDFKTMKKRKTIESDVFGHICSCVQISEDEKYVVALSSGINPGLYNNNNATQNKTFRDSYNQSFISKPLVQTLSVWTWTKSKMNISIELTSQPTTHGYHNMILNKQTNKHICIWNQTILKFYSVGENELRQIDEFNRPMKDQFTSMCWLQLKSSGNVAQDNATFISAHGTQCGSILIFLNGKYSFHLIDLSNVPQKSVVYDHLGHSHVSITSLGSFTGGLIVGTNSGILSFFKNTITSNHNNGYLSPFVLIGEVKLETLCGEEPEDGKTSSTSCVGIQNIEIDPSEKIGMISTYTGQIISFNVEKIPNEPIVTNNSTIITNTTTNGGKMINSNTGAVNVNNNNDESETLLDQKVPLSTQISLSFLHSQFHKANKAIVAIDICSRKPLLVTCSKDKTIKFWNYRYHTLLFSKVIVEDVYSIALHPSGHQIAIGYLDKLRVYHILINDIRLCLEISVKACRECQFSRGGSRLAMTNGSIITIYDFSSGEKIIDLRGHNSKVRGLYWLDQYSNTQLLSCGQDGAVYHWDIRSGKRLHEYLLKGVLFSTLIATKDYTVLVLGNDGYIRELDLKDLSMIRVYDVRASNSSTGNKLNASSIVMSKTKKICVVGRTIQSNTPSIPSLNSDDTNINNSSTSRSSISIFPYVSPATQKDLDAKNSEQAIIDMESEVEVMNKHRLDGGTDESSGVVTILPEVDEFISNTGEITQMKLSSDENYLVTGDDLGNVILYEVHQDKGHKISITATNSIAMNITEFTHMSSWTDDIIVSLSELEEKANVISELKNRLEELHLNHEYQLKLLEMAQWDKMKASNEDQGKQNDKSRIQLIAMKTDFETVEREGRIAMIKRQERHDITIHDLENKYQKELVALVEAVRTRTQQRDLLTVSLEQQRKKLVAEHEKKANKLLNQYEIKLRDLVDANKILKDENINFRNELNEKISSLENDVDDTVQGLKKQYELKLETIRENALRYKGEISLMLKKEKNIRNDIDDCKNDVVNLVTVEKSLHEQMNRLEKEVLNHRKEIKSRDVIIEDREKKIYELKKKNHELEKFKFVLDFKIKELKTQIEPRQEEIGKLRDKIKDADEELEKWHTDNINMDNLIGDIRSKVETLQTLLNSKRATRHKQEHTTLDRFRSDVQIAVEYILSIPELKQISIDLVQKHGSKGAIKPLVDPDVENEYTRHRDFLKKSVRELQEDYEEAIMKRLEANKMHLKSNMALLTEINQQKNINSQLKKTVQAMMASIRQANQSYQKHRKLDLNRSNIQNKRTMSTNSQRSNSLNKFFTHTVPSNAHNRADPNAFAFTTYYNADGTPMGMNNSTANIGINEEHDQIISQNQNEGNPSKVLKERKRRIVALQDAIDILKGEFKLLTSDINDDTDMMMIRDNNNPDANVDFEEEEKEEEEEKGGEGEREEEMIKNDNGNYIEEDDGDDESAFFNRINNFNEPPNSITTDEKLDTMNSIQSETKLNMNASVLSMSDSIADTLDKLSITEPFLNLGESSVNLSNNGIESRSVTGTVTGIAVPVSARSSTRGILSARLGTGML